MLQQKFEDSVMNYRVSKQKALKLFQYLDLDSLNPDEFYDEASIVHLQLAEIVYKETLKKDFKSMDAKASELRDALKARGDTDKAVKERMKFNRMEEHKNITQIIDFLQIILCTLKFNDFNWPIPKEYKAFKENIVNVKDKNVEKRRKFCPRYKNCPLSRCFGGRQDRIQG